MQLFMLFAEIYNECSSKSDKCKTIVQIILAFLNILQIIKRNNSYSESVDVKYNIIICICMDPN